MIMNNYRFFSIRYLFVVAERKIENKKNNLKMIIDSFKVNRNIFIHIKDNAVCLISRHSISTLKSYTT